MSKLQLNLDSKPFVSKKSEDSHAITIKINKKLYIPKYLNKHSNKVSNEKSNTKTYKKYFIIDEDDEKTTYKFDFDYMISFENWEICQETNILPEDVLKHLEKLKIMKLEPREDNKRKNKSKYRKKNNTKEKASPEEFIEKASPEEFIKKLKEQPKADPIKYKIIEYLNILSIDNYKNISEEIYKLIVDDTYYQEKFLDVIFNKSIKEKKYVKLYAKLTIKEKKYVKLYAKLIKDLDKSLPQRYESNWDAKTTNGTPKKPSSIMRIKLLDKCRRNLSENELNERINSYNLLEREIKIKEFFLGNANFVSELINMQVLSKKIIFQYIDRLLSKFNEEKKGNSLKMIYLESIVFLLDNFGTLLKIKEKKMKEEDKKEYNEKINFYIKKLGEVIEKEKDIV